MCDAEDFSRECSEEMQLSTRNFLLKIEGRSAVPDPGVRRISIEELLLCLQQYYGRCVPKDGFNLAPAPPVATERAYLVTVTCLPSDPLEEDELRAIYTAMKKSKILKISRSVGAIELTKAGLPHLHVAYTSAVKPTKTLLGKCCVIMKRAGFVDVKCQKPEESMDWAYKCFSEYATKEQ